MSNFEGMVAMRVESGMKELRDQIAVIQQRLSNPLLTGGSKFVARTQVYISTVLDDAIREIGGIRPGETRNVRGVKIKGWATWQRKAYGGFVTETTLYRFRKFARGSVAKETGRTWSREKRKFFMEMPVEERPWEKVYNQSASGALYTEGSQLMQDTGQMRASVFMVDLRVVGNAIEVRPNRSVCQYLEDQNDMRNFWFLEQKDEERIGVLAQEMLDEIAADITKGVS